MGWASYLEDIIERFTCTIGPAEQLLEKSGEHAKLEAAADSLHFVLCEAKHLRDELYKRLAIATDPQIELAHRIVELREKVRQLEREVGGLQSALSRAQENVARLQPLELYIKERQFYARKLPRLERLLREGSQRLAETEHERDNLKRQMSAQQDEFQAERRDWLQQRRQLLAALDAAAAENGHLRRRLEEEVDVQGTKERFLDGGRRLADAPREFRQIEAQLFAVEQMSDKEVQALLDQGPDPPE